MFEDPSADHRLAQIEKQNEALRKKHNLKAAPATRRTTVHLQDEEGMLGTHHYLSDRGVTKIVIGVMIFLTFPLQGL